MRPIPKTVAEALAWYGNDDEFTPLIDAEPTSLRPGSEEKLLLMRQRVERGEPLHEAGDTVIAWSPREQKNDVETKEP